MAKSTDLKKLPFSQTLPEARKAGAIVRLFGRNAVVELWQVVEVDKRGKLLLLQRMPPFSDLPPLGWESVQSQLDKLPAHGGYKPNEEEQINGWREPRN